MLACYKFFSKMMQVAYAFSPVQTSLSDVSEQKEGRGRDFWLHFLLRWTVRGRQKSPFSLVGDVASTTLITQVIYGAYSLKHSTL